jgi:hypothetical protein
VTCCKIFLHIVNTRWMCSLIHICIRVSSSKIIPFIHNNDKYDEITLDERQYIQNKAHKHTHFYTDALTDTHALKNRHVRKCVRLWWKWYDNETIVSYYYTGAVVVVWYLDWELPVQSMPITTRVVSSNTVHGEVYSIQHYVIKFVSDLRQVGGFLRVLQFPPPIKLTATI